MAKMENPGALAGATGAEKPIHATTDAFWQEKVVKNFISSTAIFTRNKTSARESTSHRFTDQIRCKNVRSFGVSLNIRHNNAGELIVCDAVHNAAWSKCIDYPRYVSFTQSNPIKRWSGTFPQDEVAVYEALSGHLIPEDQVQQYPIPHTITLAASTCYINLGDAA